LKCFQSCCTTGPNVVCSFWKCFGPGLAASPNSVRSSNQVRPNSFWQSRQYPQPQFLNKKTQQRNAPLYSIYNINNTIFNINTINYSKNNNIYNTNNTIFL
jgi:hypothetical protein